MNIREKILAIILLFPMLGMAQESRIPKAVAKEIRTEKFPTTRFLDFEYEVLSSGDFKSKIYKQNYEEETIKSTNRVKIALNYPVYKTQKLVITPVLRYKFESLSFDNVKNESQVYPQIYHGKNVNYHYISTSVNTTYFSKLFNKHTMYNLTIGGDASQKGFEHFTASLLGMMVIKREKHRTMSVGAIIVLDKRALSPVIPLFSYEYKFADSEWSFDTTLPTYVYFRRPLFTDGRISLALNFDGLYSY